MKKKSARALASGALMSLVLTTALSAVPVKAAAGQVTRVGAADRYATAAQVATTNWTTSDNVVLVSGEGYADAVSASALAKKLNAPILLTTAKSLSTDTISALNTLKAKNVYVVGGEASVSTAVRTELKKTYSLVELGGANRYETNVAVAQKLVELGVDPSNVIMVGGEGFSDALSVAPVAAAKGQILLLGMNNAEYIKPVLDFIANNKSKVTVVGTKNVISDDILNTFGGTRVDGGSDRWDTNQKVLAAFKDTIKMDKLYVASAAYNAQDNGYADALVASALAGKYAAPLVLVDKDESTGTNNALAYIKANGSNKTDLNVVGGTGVVSNNIVKSIDDLFKTTTGNNTVSEISATNLNQFDIVFNTNVDEDTAELLSNYKVAGTQLTSSNAHTELINDNTVRVTLVQAAFGMKQGEEAVVSVKSGILTADKTKTIEKFDKKIEFKDITAPTIKNVSMRGNNKLVIEFSEAVNMQDITTLKSLIQVNGKSLSSVDVAVKESATNGTETWASKVEIYFNTGLNSGENTVKIKDAKNGVLVDAAGFSFKEETKSVTVDAVTTKPEVKEITEDGGDVSIKFDRAMDTKTAVNAAYYTINDKALTGATVELKDNDTVVKISGIADGILKDKTNIIEITDDVKDAYGNKVAEDTRVTFNKEKDETKPTVVSATILDSKTLRVQFSENVKYAYATNLDNYQLRDAYNVDLMKKAGVTIVAADATSSTDTDDTDTYDIKFTGADTLNSSKYTLTIKNIIDKATEPNKMDDYTTTIDGNDDQAPSIDDMEVFVKSNTEVAIYFGKEMNEASIVDKANYYYINGDGETKELPDDVDITVSSDNKGVVLDFDNANKKVQDTEHASTGDDIVKKIGIKTVKDTSGNQLYVGTLAINATSTNGPKLEDNTFKLYKEGNDVKASFQLDNALDTINPADFKISGIEANDADIDGKTVVLTFKDGDSADAVKALGTTAELQISPSATNASEDIAGRDIKAGAQILYYNQIAPETDRDNYSATVTLDTESKVTDAVVKITMKTPVDGELLGSYKDDFIITNSTKGTKLDITSVTQEGNTLIFTIKDAATKVAVGDKIGITAADASNIDIRTAEDRDGNHVKFVPSADDMKVKTVTVQ